MFWQIHRSTLVNVNAVADVTRDMHGGTCGCNSGAGRSRSTVSETYNHLFRQM